ncbi:acyl carrier protein [Streptomyces sp. L2]|uniref:acyl carrier protein n=1 Tax=Streptomyces sp. L2 TaxID=2162665 RepID=UPI001F508009|nr:acyl carrier protein [Streptomyces sp. L2]
MLEMSECHVAFTAALTTLFKVPAESIEPAATLDDLGLDSLAVVEIFLALQEQWNVPLDESDARPDLTVHQTVQMLEEQLRAGRAEGRS